MAGEWKNPPTTLVKVHKSLATHNDGGGVVIDPVTLQALGIVGSDGKPTGGIDYSAAKLSVTGKDKPGPFGATAGQTPKPTIMFKRENPDEICAARSSNVECPAIVVGTWRDLTDFQVGGGTSDYDDGLPELAPQRLQPDATAPALLQLKVFSSYSLILSFDERLAADLSKLTFSAVRASDGSALPLRIKRVGKVGDADLMPSQIWLKTDNDEAMALGETYTLTYSGIRDVVGNSQVKAISQNFTAPTTLVPDEDKKAPAVLTVLPKSPTSLTVLFDESVDAATAANAANYSIATKGGGAGPSVSAAALGANGTSVELTTTDQAKQADYVLTVKSIVDLAVPPNVLTSQAVAFKGFGDDQAPKVVFAQALSPTELAVAFDEPLSPLTAAVPTSYSIAGLTVSKVDFSGDATRKAAAFNPATTTFSENVVVLTTSAMAAGSSYTVIPSGVTDLGQRLHHDRPFKGVAEAPKVDVVLTYRVSGSDQVGGMIPARAITPQDVLDQREGIFVLGSTATPDGGKIEPADAITKQLGTFPPEGQPTAGLAKQLADNGQNGDITAGDAVYAIRLKDVPLGTTILWKAFASYTVAYKNANPENLSAAFADATPGPAVFGDGQEYPGNENGVRILGDSDGDGVVRIDCLFGDEVTYKKFTNAPVFVWTVGDVSWKK